MHAAPLTRAVIEGAIHMRLRRRLQASVNASANGAGGDDAAALLSATASSGSLAPGLDEFETTTEDEEQAFTPEQLVALSVSGWLAVTLYSLVALAILVMTVQHFRHSSSPRKRLFHVILLVSVTLNLPDPLGWLLWPDSESWVYTYPLRIYSLLLQSVCKSIISVCWSEVVSAGQSDERRRVTYLVMAFNGVLLVWGISVPFLLSKYPNDVYGQYDFMMSTLRGIMTYSGVGVIFVYGLILTYQGMRLRRRLLQAKGTVPVGSVEKSLNQLMLTVYVIVFADLMRIGSLALYEMKVDMPMTTFLVCNNLIPNIFPTICMLYLMRRFSKQDDDDADVQKPQHHHQRAHFMTEERDMDRTSTPVLGMSKFSMPASRIASIDRVPLGHHAPSNASGHLVDSRGARSSLSPTSHWVRE